MMEQPISIEDEDMLVILRYAIKKAEFEKQLNESNHYIAMEDDKFLCRSDTRLNFKASFRLLGQYTSDYTWMWAWHLTGYPEEKLREMLQNLPTGLACITKFNTVKFQDMIPIKFLEAYLGNLHDYVYILKSTDSDWVTLIGLYDTEWQLEVIGGDIVPSVESD
jgi:hypothetical protein